MNQIKKSLIGIFLSIGIGLLAWELFRIAIGISRRLSEMGLQLLGEAVIVIGTLVIISLTCILLFKLQFRPRV